MKLLHPVSYYETDFGKQLAATIVWAQVFAIYTLAFFIIRNPTESEVQWADPVLKIIPISISLWVTILLSFTLGMVALRKIGPGSLLANTPKGQIITGVLAAMAVGFTLRMIVGDTLPDFVPTEESSKPGFMFGMVAGYGEEVIFRMLITPLTFFSMCVLLKSSDVKKRIIVSAIVAILVTAASFVLAHELGEADGIVVWKLVATRFMMPGLIMGSLFFLVGPGFVIFMHATMHIMIPLLFH